jgi:hypothetical protein
VKATVALIAATLTLTLAAAVAAQPSTGERKATLRLATAHPVALRGSRFLAGERVAVVVSSQGRIRSRTVTAGDVGTFIARFTGMPFDRCSGLLAVAHGARGSVAVYRTPPAMCPPS